MKQRPQSRIHKRTGLATSTPNVLILPGLLLQWFVAQLICLENLPSLTLCVLSLHIPFISDNRRPITLPLLHNTIAVFHLGFYSYVDAFLIALFLLVFYGILRITELMHIRISNFTI